MIDLRARLVGGGSAVGTFVQAPHPVVVEVLAGSGVDLVCIDQEHAPIGVETMHALVGAAALGDVPAIVRVPEAGAHAIGAALDAGAAGVLVPRIETAEQAAAAVRWARYPPAGERGVGPARASAYGARIREELLEANARALVAVQIETRRGVDALDELLAVEGVDLVFVGPGDLAASLGDAASVARVVDDVLDRAAVAGRSTGIFAPDAATAGAWLARGVGLVLVGNDLGFLATAVTSAISALPSREI